MISTGAGNSAATDMDEALMDISKSEGPTADPKESKSSTGESSRPKNGLEERDDSSLERPLRVKSAASQSSNPLTELTEGLNMSLGLLSMPLEAFLPTSCPKEEEWIRLV